MTSRPSTVAPILAVLAVGLGAYVGGYFVLGKRVDYGFFSPTNGRFLIGRYYRTAWMAMVFAPAAKVEGWFSRYDVETKARQQTTFESELPDVDWPEKPLPLRRP